jgi:hypothetical protein
MTLFDLSIDTEDPTDWPDWYVERRLRGGLSAALMEALTAAWNPNLHPRGPDGKFIMKFGFVRWLDMDTKSWKAGYVRDIDGKTGDVFVRNAHGTEFTFSRDSAQKKLYARPKPKAKLKLPSIGKKNPDVPMDKIGPQGGSNPGGLFVSTAPVKGDTPKLTRSESWNALAAITFSGTPFEGDVDNQVDWPSRAVVSIPDAQGEYTTVFRNEGKWYKVPTDDVPLYGPTGELNPEYRLSSLDDVIGVPGSDRRKALLDADSPVLVTAPDPQIDDAEVVGVIRASAPDGINLGDEYYVKKMPDDPGKGDPAERARNEALANMLYEMAGVPVPEVSVGDDGKTVASKIVVAEAFDKNNLEHVKAMRKDFVFDAWLANWDAVGLSYDNVKIDDEGRAWRIDAGGAMLFRAMGASKGDKFGNTVGELDTMKSPGLNPTAAKVYGGVTNGELTEQMDRLSAVTPDEIRDLVDSHHMEPWVADTLIARRQNIFDQLGYKPKPTPVPDVVIPDEKADVYNPLTEKLQPGEAPTAAVANYEWEIGNVPSSTFFLSDEGPAYTNMVLKIDDGNMIVTADQIQYEDDGGISFLPIDVGTGNPAVGHGRMKFALNDPLTFVLDGDGEQLDTGSIKFDDLQTKLQVQRDLAIAEIVDKSRGMTETEILDITYENSFPEALPGQTQIVGQADLKRILDNKIPLYTDAGGMYEIVEVNAAANGMPSFVTLRNNKGQYSTWYSDTMLGSEQWFAPQGVLEPVWRTHIEDRNVKFADDKVDLDVFLPDPTPPDVDIPDVAVDVDLPAPVPLPDVATVDPTPVSVQGVNPSMNPTDEPKLASELFGLGTVSWGDKFPNKYGDQDEKKAFVNKSIPMLEEQYVGKPVVLLTSDQLAAVGEDNQFYQSGGLVWVKGFSVDYYGNPQMEVAKPNGDSYSLNLFGHNGTLNYALTPVDVEPPTKPIKPTMRKDGKVMVGKVHIGQWYEPYTHPSGAYGYIVEIQPQFSVTGGKVMLKKNKKSWLSKDMGSYISPDGIAGALPQPKGKKKEIDLTKSGLLVGETPKPGAITLRDGVVPKKGMTVLSVGDGNRYTLAEDNKYGSNQIMVTDADGKEKFVPRGALVMTSKDGVPTVAASQTITLNDGKTAGPDSKVVFQGNEYTFVHFDDPGALLVMDWYGAKKYVTPADLTLVGDDEPRLMYTKDQATKAAGLIGKKVKKQEIGPVKYPGPGGKTIAQDKNLGQAKIDKGIKVTKDGYAPQMNMVLRRESDDSQWVVIDVADDWHKTKAGKVQVVNPKTGDKKWLVSSGFNVDHGAMLTGADGKELESIKTIEGIGTFQPPNGSIIFAKDVKKNVGGGRQQIVTEYLVLDNNGDVVYLHSGDKAGSYWNEAKADYVWSGTTVKIGMVDYDNGDRKITMTTDGTSDYNKGNVTGIAITNLKTDGAKSIAEEAADKAAKSEGVEAPKYTGPSITTGDKLPDGKISTGSESNVPNPVLKSGTHLADKGDALRPMKGTNSTQDAVDKTLAKLADADHSDVSSYAIADGDLIEDMNVATGVVNVDGVDYVEVRFRLNDDPIKSLHADLHGDEKAFGAWGTDTRKVNDVVLGDKMRVRVGHNGTLKPSQGVGDAAPPNATVAATPTLVGQNADGKDVWRYVLSMSNGETGVMHLEDRGYDSVFVAAWDDKKARPVSSGSQSLSGSAHAAGWKQRASSISYDKADDMMSGSSVGQSTVKTDSGALKVTSGSQGVSVGNGQVVGRSFDTGEVRVTFADNGTKNSANGRVRIRVRADDPDAQLKVANAMEMVGVDADKQNPPTAEDLQKMALNKVHQQFVKKWVRGEGTKATVQNSGTVTSLIDEAIGTELGRKSTLADISISADPATGKIQVLLSEDIAAAIVKKNGVKQYTHSLGGSATKVLDEWLDGNTTQLLGADDRFAQGMFYSGMNSLGTDYNNGAGHRVYTRMSQQTKAGHLSSSGGSSNRPQIIFDPISIHRQVDYYYSEDDSFGARSEWNWKFMLENESGNKMSVGGSNELVFKDGMSHSSWGRVAVQPSYVEEWRKKAKEKMGPTAPNGMSWDDFIIPLGADISSMHDDTAAAGGNVGGEITLEALS